MASTSASEAARIQQEIALLTGAINRHKSGSTDQPVGYSTSRPRNNAYVNPNYKPPTGPPTKYFRPPAPIVKSQAPQVASVPGPSQTREVVIGGVAFESSGRSLVRKDLPKPAAAKAASSRPTANPHTDLSRTKAGHLIPNGRTFKPKSSRGRGAGRGRGRGRGRSGPVNMTLDNSRRPYQTGRSKRAKFLDKPCPRFTTTGACSRGLTCMYQHDPTKIAICWNFLQGNCPNTANNCQLSHDPTPERTPLCVHFANNGRCTRDNCPYPHVRVGARHGVCRDFAVLGYCDKGLDCDKQHVRECPDFAEHGSCTTKGCKLPHVIRANRTRKPAAPTTTSDNTSSSAKVDANSSDVISDTPTGADTDPSLQHASAEDAQLGDEYISLTFHESESSSEDDEGEEEEDDNEEEGDDPNDDDPAEDSE